MKRKLKQIPSFTSDEAMEEFLEKTDLSDYDFGLQATADRDSNEADARQQESADSENQEKARTMTCCVQMPTKTKASSPQ
jgi:hypothetical protein